MDDLDTVDPALLEHRVALAHRAPPRDLPTLGLAARNLRSVAVLGDVSTLTPATYDRHADRLRRRHGDLETADRILRASAAAGLGWDDLLRLAGLEARSTPVANPAGDDLATAADDYVSEHDAWPSYRELLAWAATRGLRLRSKTRSGLTQGELWDRVSERRAARGLETPRPRRPGRPRRSDGRPAYLDQPRPPHELWTLERILDGLAEAHRLAAAAGRPLTQRTLRALAAEHPAVPHPSKVDRVGRAHGIERPLHTLRRRALDAQRKPDA